MTNKAKFHWARIGDGNFEPVAVKGKAGNRLAYTIGCPDPFEVDGPNSAILLEKEWDGQEAEPLEPPLTPKQEKNALARERRAAKLLASHRYAGFGRP